MSKKGNNSKNFSKPSNFHRTGSASKNGKPSTYTWEQSKSNRE